MHPYRFDYFHSQTIENCAQLFKTFKIQKKNKSLFIFILKHTWWFCGVNFTPSLIRGVRRSQQRQCQWQLSGQPVWWSGVPRWSGWPHMWRWRLQRDGGQRPGSTEPVCKHHPESDGCKRRAAEHLQEGAELLLLLFLHNAASDRSV